MNERELNKAFKQHLEDVSNKNIVYNKGLYKFHGWGSREGKIDLEHLDTIVCEYTRNVDLNHCKIPFREWIDLINLIPYEGVEICPIVEIINIIDPKMDGFKLECPAFYNRLEQNAPIGLPIFDITAMHKNKKVVISWEKGVMTLQKHKKEAVTNPSFQESSKIYSLMRKLGFNVDNLPLENCYYYSVLKHEQ